MYNKEQGHSSHLCIIKLSEMKIITTQQPANKPAGSQHQQHTFRSFSKTKGLLLLFAIIFSLSSCKKAVETFNMIGTWEVDSYSENGVDRTTYFKETFVNYRIKFDVAKTFLETANVAGVDINNGGSWKVLSGGGSLELTYLSDSTVRVLELVDVKRNSSIIRENATGKQFSLNKL